MQQVERGALRPALVVGAAAAAAVITLGIGVGAGSARVVVGVLGLGILAWLVAQWRAGVYVLVLTGCVDGFLKLATGSIAAYVLKDALLGAIVIGLLARVVLEPAERLPWVWRGLGQWALYFGFIFAQIFNPAVPLLESIAAFRARALFALLYVVGAFFFNSGAGLVRFVWVAICGIAFAGTIGIIQVAVGNAWLELGPRFAHASLHYTSFSNLGPLAIRSFRAYGTTVDPAALGIAAMYGLMLAGGLATAVRGSRRWALAGLAAIMLVALILTQTRSAGLGAIVGGLVLSILLASTRGTRGAAIPALLIFAVLVAGGVYALNRGGVGRLSEQSNSYAAMTRERSAAIVLQTA